jgi:oligopeptide/dipeptide ABC transporter ATP-binding protein
METPFLEVDNLTVHFSRSVGVLGRFSKTTKAVEKVSFGMNESEVLCLVGESGSGKTTLGRCIAALVKPTSGKVMFMGADVTKFRGHALHEYRKQVQMVFQDPFGSLNPRNDAHTIIATPIRKLNGEKKREDVDAEVTRLLQEVGLGLDVMHKLPHQLSGGERQRVSVARALASRPRILVADEPVTMLDASLRMSFLQLFASLRKRRNMALLLITHDLASAKVMGGNTAVMYLGRIVEYGPTSTILSRPQHPYTELLLASTPRMNALYATDETMSTIEKSQRVSKGCVFRPRCPYATQVCAEVEPPLETKTGGHPTACHNWLNRPQQSGGAAS